MILDACKREGFGVGKCFHGFRSRKLGRGYPLFPSAAMAQVIAGKFQAIVRDRIGCTAVDGRIPASGWGCRKQYHEYQCWRAYYAFGDGMSPQ